MEYLILINSENINIINLKIQFEIRQISTSNFKFNLKSILKRIIYIKNETFKEEYWKG